MACVWCADEGLAETLIEALTKHDSEDVYNRAIPDLFECMACIDGYHQVKSKVGLDEQIRQVRDYCQISCEKYLWNYLATVELVTRFMIVSLYCLHASLSFNTCVFSFSKFLGIYFCQIFPLIFTCVSLWRVTQWIRTLILRSNGLWIKPYWVLGQA